MIKVWTTFAVAMYFDITTSPLNDYIIRWLRAAPNTHFLEVLPEVSLKIADGLKCYDLTRDTFAILVGEEALANLYRGRTSLENTRNVHGRKRDDVPEAYQTRIEYASKAFVERIDEMFNDFALGEMSWLFNNISEWKKLEISSGVQPSPAYFHAVAYLISDLKAFVRGTILFVLCSKNGRLLASQKEDGDGDDLYPTFQPYEAWGKLRPHERILTRTFWQALQGCSWSSGMSNLEIGSKWNLSHGEWNEYAEGMVSCNKLKKVDVSDLENMLVNCQRLYKSDAIEALVASATAQNLEVVRASYILHMMRAPH